MKALYVQSFIAKSEFQMTTTIDGFHLKSKFTKKITKGDGFSFIFGFMKRLCTPDNPLLSVLIY